MLPTRVTFLRRVPKFAVAAFVVFILIGCDQVTKSIAERALRVSGPVEYISGFVSFQPAENEGGFLGIGSALPAGVRLSIAVGLLLFTSAAFIALLVFARRTKMAILISYSMMVAGAFGNLMDHVLNQGRVFDFIVLGSSVIHTGIFNLADACLTIGAAMLVVLHAFHARNQPGHV